MLSSFTNIKPPAVFLISIKRRFLCCIIGIIQHGCNDLYSEIGYQEMRRKRRYILLLLDNVSTHRLDDNEQLSNAKLHFLPPNTTAHLQPLDQGIIYSFKVVIYSFCVMYNYISELTCSFFRLTIGNYSAKTE